MWNYEKRLEYPINIKQTNPALAAMIISQYGGPYFNKVYRLKIEEASTPSIFVKRNKLLIYHFLCRKRNGLQRCVLRSLS